MALPAGGKQTVATAASKKKKDAKINTAGVSCTQAVVFIKPNLVLHKDTLKKQVQIFTKYIGRT